MSYLTLHSTAAGIHLSGRGDGLVQPLRSGLGSIDFLGDIILCGGAGLGSTERSADHLQHRPRIAVHQRALHEPAGDSWHRHQHGWARPRDRQHLHRTVVAFGEIRGGLSQGLRGRAGRAEEPEDVFQFLQSRTTASGIGLSNAGDGPLPTTEEQETHHAGAQARCRSSSINDPGAKVFRQLLDSGTKKEKRNKKERKLRKGKLVETATAVEIDKGSLRRLFLDDFHRCLKKSTHKTLRLFHSYHKLGGG